MTWCVNSILTTFTLQRFSHTMSSSILYSFPFAPSHLGLFIKSRDVIDENYVKFNSCDLWDNFDMNTKKNLRSNANIKVPKFNTYYMKNSFSRRGPIVFNTLLQESNLRNITIKQLSSLAYKSKALLNLNFNSISPQTVNFKDPNFKYF